MICNNYKESQLKIGTSVVRAYRFEDIIKNLCNANENLVKDCISFIKSSLLDNKLLSNNEETMLFTFENLYKKLNAIPSFEIFQNQFSKTKVDSNVEMQDVLSLVKLFVTQRKDLNTSKLLINEAKRIPVEGKTPEIMEHFTNILNSSSTNVKYENIMDRIVDLYDRKLDNSGIKTGIEQIDKEIGGLKAGQVSVLAGFTGMGKSICSVSIMHSAITQGYNVCYISLEISAEHLMYNLISRHSLEPKMTKKIEHKNLKSKSLTKEERDYVESDILPDLDSLPGKFYILDEQDIESYDYFVFDSKLQEIENLCIEETGKGLDLLIIDHIQMLAYSDQSSNLSENTVINRWCNYFRSNCLDFLKTKRQIHTILVSQINRQGYQKAIRRDGMYDMTALKEANELETCAAVILGIFSDPSLIVSKQAKIGILKNRDGNRSNDAMVVPADFAHQLIGSTGSTIHTTMDDDTFQDIMGVFDNYSDFDDLGLNTAIGRQGGIGDEFGEITFDYGSD